MSDGPQVRSVLREGIWDNNPVLGQMLGLCPAMAVTSSATNGLGMGLATTAVLAITNALVASMRHWVVDAVRIPIFIVLIAGIVTLVDVSLNAWFHDLYKVLGIFIALIVVNCAVLGRAEAFAARNSVAMSALDGLATGLGFTLALTTLGAVREVTGAGTLFANAHLMFGPAFSVLETQVLPPDSGALMMILPPGGFLAIGLLIAGRRRIEQHVQSRARGEQPLAAPASAE